MNFLWAFLALLAAVTAEIADYDDYEVTLIRQKTACPTVYCPWNCERYVDRNGCLFCGRCSPKTQCPLIKCPNLPHFGCVARVGRDGCTTCKCQSKAIKYQQSAQMQQHEPVKQPPPQQIGCTHSPMCSADCSIVKDVNGCDRCACPAKSTWASTCPEAPDAPCKRPDCFRERGADGCYHCICPDDVYSCPEIRCDPKKKCVHTVDTVTGCATGCQCETNNNSYEPKPSKPQPIYNMKTMLRQLHG